MSFLLAVFSNLVAFGEIKKGLTLFFINTGHYFREKSYKLITNAQNSYIYVKIDL